MKIKIKNKQRKTIETFKINAVLVGFRHCIFRRRSRQNEYSVKGNDDEKDFRY